MAENFSSLRENNLIYWRSSTNSKDKLKESTPETNSKTVKAKENLEISHIQSNPIRLIVNYEQKQWSPVGNELSDLKCLKKKTVNQAKPFQKWRQNTLLNNQKLGEFVTRRPTL